MDFLRMTNSWKTNEMRTELIHNIPKKPTKAAEPGIGDWSELENTQQTTIYHISAIQEQRITVDEYLPKGNTLELAKWGSRSIELADTAQTIRVQHSNHSQLIGFNPLYPTPPDTSIWLHRPYRILDLEWIQENGVGGQTVNIPQPPYSHTTPSKGTVWGSQEELNQPSMKPDLELRDYHCRKERKFMIEFGSHGSLAK